MASMYVSPAIVIVFVLAQKCIISVVKVMMYSLMSSECRLAMKVVIGLDKHQSVQQVSERMLEISSSNHLHAFSFVVVVDLLYGIKLLVFFATL